MLEFVRAKLIVILVSVGLLAGMAGVVALAAPGGNTDPQGPAGLEVTGTPTVTATVEPTEALEPTETPEAETPEADETPDGEDAQQHEDGLGVPLDSPACAGDPEHPNPHDTDGDGDGCREVELPDGSTKNLPDPAADAQEGNPGHISDVEDHGNGHGRPTGEPPYGNAYGHQTATPTPPP